MTRTLRRLALAALVFAAWVAAVVAPANASDITYPGLASATTVQDTDLIATWRASGPLTKVQASVLEAYMQLKMSLLFLQPANNLSDVANPTTARANLGLGSAAQAGLGTSGLALCLLNANCAWSGTENFQAKVTTGTPVAGGAMFNLPPGAAPTSPVNGDVWGTSGGLFAYLNGGTQQIAFLTSNVASATTATSATTASKWQTARTETCGGDMTGGTASVDGSGNWTLPCTISPGSVTGAKIAASTVANGNMAGMAAFTFKGNANAGSSIPQDLSAAQALAILNQGFQNCCNPGVFTIASFGGSPLYVEWGVYDCGSSNCWNSSTPVTITVPTPFPHTGLVVVATPYNPANVSSARYPTVCGAPTATSFSMCGEGASDEGFYWVEIGD